MDVIDQGNYYTIIYIYLKLTLNLEEFVHIYIIRNSFWVNLYQNIVTYVATTFQGDSTKYYIIIHKQNTAWSLT
jgi:hypothetical protein